VSQQQGKIDIRHDPETGDMQVNSNLDPAAIISLLEMAKYRLMEQRLGDES